MGGQLHPRLNTYTSQTKLSNNRSVMPLDVRSYTCATITVPASLETVVTGIGACTDYVPALCTHRQSLIPIECFSEVVGLASL
ncbi:unnamed protein product [Schistosoma mansoni]|uniref:Smp_205510 n=1 Tax=Schistosoma mansoni TaxID=6183 RepID=UPI00022C84B5|nr:unnamed protein product [Schistosoma mansoni]|eukprot:XP_018647440.1 unnamed protein product [Schistosoma mansoni]